jgi:hypothetical protein
MIELRQLPTAANWKKYQSMIELLDNDIRAVRMPAQARRVTANAVGELYHPPD